MKFVDNTDITENDYNCATSILTGYINYINLQQITV